MGWLLVFFPFSRYRGGRPRPVGCGVTSTGPCLSPAPCHQVFPPRGFRGIPGKRLLPCPSGGLTGTAACRGYHLVQFCIIKLPWLFLLETFTILCLAGKDDCSKPKLGINYTTTLHFSYKGKNCVARAVKAPPSYVLPARLIVEGHGLHRCLGFVF